MAEKFKFTQEELDKMVLEALKDEAKPNPAAGGQNALQALMDAAKAQKVAQ